MIYNRSEKELNLERPMQMVKPVIDYTGKSIKNLYVSDDCKFYDIDEYNSHEYFGDCPEADIAIHQDNRGRLYSSINVEPRKSDRQTCQVARVAKIMFDEGKHPIEYYQDKQIDHINPAVPVKNCIENLEFVTHEENMYRAGESGVMIKKYDKSMAHTVCQMTCDGKSRAEIMQELGVNGQFVDDVRAGRSHKSVSCQYLDKGFQYKTYDRHWRDDLIHAICKTIEENPDMKVKDICLLHEIDDHRFVSAIRNKSAYNKISDQYNFKASGRSRCPNLKSNEQSKS